MPCPKCSGKLHDSGPTNLASAYWGSDTGPVELSEPSLSCWACGAIVFRDKLPKQLDIGKKCGKRLPALPDIKDQRFNITQNAIKFVSKHYDLIEKAVITRNPISLLYVDTLSKLPNCPHVKMIYKYFNLEAARRNPAQVEI